MQSTERCVWKCAVGNLKRWKGKSELVLNKNGIVLAVSLLDHAEGLVEFKWNNELTFAQIVALFGNIPLPPYLHRNPAEEDIERYQTVYSKFEGAVAAPTAGLHFTAEVLEELKRQNIKTDYLTLHVSAGTFQPIKVQNALEHKMHEEEVILTRENIVNLLEKDRFIVPVGTTSMRSLESAYWFGVKLSSDPSVEFVITQDDAYVLKQDVSVEESLRKVLAAMEERKTDTIVGRTSIYIVPGYKFRIAHGLITNFHQPGSTLMLLVAALVGNDWKKIYQEALDKNYRFLSYGDSSLLIP
jgi:S-adenosylmethionine:tRNA ribosyltransferase-isomerase